MEEMFAVETMPSKAVGQRVTSERPAPVFLLLTSTCRVKEHKETPPAPHAPLPAPLPQASPPADPPGHLRGTTTEEPLSFIHTSFFFLFSVTIQKTPSLRVLAYRQVQ